MIFITLHRDGIECSINVDAIVALETLGTNGPDMCEITVASGGALQVDETREEIIKMLQGFATRQKFEMPPGMMLAPPK